MSQDYAPPDQFEAAVNQVNKNTVTGLYPLWMDNWAHNLQLARAGDSLDKLYQRPSSGRVLIVGRGPSIKKYGHLDMLRKHPFPGHIIASDGAVPLLAERGIVPYLSMTVDGSEIIAKWFTGPTAKIGSKLKAVLPLTAHPKTVNAARKIGAHIYWYIPELDQEPLKGVTEALQLQTYSPSNPTGISRSNGAGNCGLAAVVLANSILRAKEVVMIGMDSGYPPDTPLEECHYHEGMLRSCGYDAQQVARLYRMYHHPELKYTVVDPVFEIYRRTFLTIAKAYRSAGVKIVNCTEGGCLFDESVAIMKFRNYLKISS